jgi:hypothetical protein
MAAATKKEKKRKEEAYPWKTGTSSGHIQTLSNLFWRLSISMVLIHAYRRQLGKG